MAQYKCPECSNVFAAGTTVDKLKSNCSKCKKETEHVKFDGTITATNAPERAFISSFAEVNLAPAPAAKPVEVKPTPPTVTKLDVKSAPQVKK